MLERCMRRNYSKGIIITAIICILLCSSSIFSGLYFTQFSIFLPALITDASAQTDTQSESDTTSPPTTDTQSESDTTSPPTTDTQSESDTTSPPTTDTQSLTDVNNPPEANVGANPSQVNEGEMVQLNGGGSS